MVKGNEYAEARLKNELLLIENTKQSFLEIPLTFLWVDGACHPEFSQSFGVTADQLPTLVYYAPSTKT